MQRGHSLINGMSGLCTRLLLLLSTSATVLSVHAQDCSPVAPPFSHGLNAPNGSLPDCFTTVNVSGASDGAWAVQALSGMYFTPPSAVITTADVGPYDAWLFLPAFQLQAATSYRLAYRYGTNSGSSGANNRGRMAVYIGNAPTVAAMTTMLQDHGTFSHAVADARIDFTRPTAGTYYVGFRVNTDPNTLRTVLDDIALTLTPACIEPTGLQALGAGFTDVTLNWACTGCTGSFIVEYGPASLYTAPGTDDQPGTNGRIATLNATAPYVLSGLAQGEDYRVFVRQQCGAAVYGAASNAATFSTVMGNTLCGRALPLECGEVMEGATHQAVALPDISNHCQRMLYQSKGAWYTVEGTGGEFVLSTMVADGGWQTGGPSIVLFNGDCGTMQCHTIADHDTDLDGARITWTTAPGAEYLVYVMGDAVSFGLSLQCADPPSCFPPTALHITGFRTTGADVAWTASGAAQVRYEVRTSGAAGSGSTGLVVANTAAGAGPLVLNGLIADTEYVLHVRSDCGAGDLSAWTELPFRTACVPTNMPYDGGIHEPTFPSCYRAFDLNGDGNSWYATNAPGWHYRDSYVFQYGEAPGAPMANDWLVTRGFNTVAGTQYRLIYRYSVLSAIYPERMQVFLGTSPMPADLTQSLRNYPVLTNNHNNTIQDTVVFSPGTGVFHVGFQVTSQSNGWQLVVGDVRVEAVPTCLPPTDISVTALTRTSASLVWTAATGAAGYSYEVRSSGAPGSGAAGLVASGTASASGVPVSGLAEASPYTIYVRTDCGAVNGLSVWSAGDVFYTLCAPVAIPYTEDFTGASVGDLPLCAVRVTPGEVSVEGWGDWVVAAPSGAVYDWPAMEVVTVEAGPHDTWLFLRGMELEAGIPYRVTFRYGTNSGSVGANNTGTMAVWLGQGVAPGDMSVSVVDLGTFSGLVFNALADVTVPNSGVWHLGFRVTSAEYSRRTVLDDIRVDFAPTCMEPTGVEVLTGSGSTVQVQWACDGCPGEFIVEYGPATVYTTPGTGAEAGPGGTIASANATSPFFITGLTSGENYRLFVRQRCTGDDFGLPSPGIAFSTPLVNGFCGQALPLVCGGTSLGATSNAPVWPNIQDFCGFNPHNATGVWYRMTGNGGNYTVSNCAEDGGYAIGNTRLTVLAGQCNAWSCVAHAEAHADGCSGTRVTWRTTPGTTYWIFATGEQSSFRLAASCTDAPACEVPAGLATTALTVDHATLSWQAETADLFDYELRTEGAPGSGANGLVEGNAAITVTTAVFNGLAANTSYTFHLRRTCADEGVLSAWTSVRFTTVCTTTDVPYNGAVSGNTLPDCFRTIDVANNGTWVAHQPGSGGYVDPYVARIGNDPGTAKDDWLLIQGLNTRPGVSYRLSFRRSVISAVYPERLAVFYGHAPVVAAMSNRLLDLPSVTNSVPQAEEIIFTPGEGPTYIGFRAYSTGNGWQLYLGDIRVEEAEACGAPPAIALQLGDDAVRVDWSCPGCAGNYYVEYGPEGFVPGTGATAGEGIMAGPYTESDALIAGLPTPVSDLRFHVRRLCDGGVFSANGPALQAVPATAVACVEVLPVEWCYGNNENSFHRYVGDARIHLRFTAGTPQSCCDRVHVYDGLDSDAPLLFSGADLGGVDVASTNIWNALTVRVVSDGGHSCADGSTEALAWQVRCSGVGVEAIRTTDITVYPVPTSDRVHLLSTRTISFRTDLVLFDATGRMVWQGQAVFHAGTPVTIDLSDLQQGTYLLQMRSGADVVVHRIQLLR